MRGGRLFGFPLLVRMGSGTIFHRCTLHGAEVRGWGNAGSLAVPNRTRFIPHYSADPPPKEESGELHLVQYCSSDLATNSFELLQRNETVFMK